MATEPPRSRPACYQTAATRTWGFPWFSKAPAAQSPRSYPKMVSPEAPSRGPGRDESMGIAQRSRTEPPQNSRNKPIFHFDGAPFSKTGGLNAPDPSRSRVLSTSGPEKRGFAREPQEKARRLIGQRRTRVLFTLNYNLSRPRESPNSRSRHGDGRGANLGRVPRLERAQRALLRPR